MKDKEKKILAITQDLSDCLEYDIENSGFVDTYDTACNLVDKGWVKLPEDNVVLSREQWEDYKKYVDKCNEAYYRGQHEAEVYYKYIQIPKERKETAEKFYEFAKAWFGDDEQNDYFVEVKNFAKQFGVEIKE